jgi:hypothetical protein
LIFTSGDKNHNNNYFNSHKTPVASSSMVEASGSNDCAINVENSTQQTTVTEMPKFNSAA